MVNGIDPMHHGIVDKAGHKVSGSDSGVAVNRGKSAETGSSPAKTDLVDTVMLTPRSQLLERLEKTAAQTPMIDRAKVDSIKADIADGNYEINVDNIADILLQIDRESGDS